MCLPLVKPFYVYTKQDDTLEWMPDGRELWAGIVDYNPTILTGLPMGTWAEPQKASVRYRRPVVSMAGAQY